LKNRIGVLNCYFGNWPIWFDYLLKSIGENSFIDWIFFTDNEIPGTQPDNIILHNLSFEDFNRLASTKLGLEIKITNSYKLCDFKPSYGKIFEDYLTEYEFWGYFDIDVIFGKINAFISEQALREYDIISTYKGFLSGPFCLFRNTNIINNLFREHQEYQNILQENKHFSFDENINLDDSRKHKLKKILNYFLFLFTNDNIRLFFISSKEFKYQFQWYYKRKHVDQQHFADMTEIVFFSNQNNKVNAYFTNLLHSDRYYQRLNYKNWIINWQGGKLVDQNKEKEIFGFHFVDLKNKVDFVIEGSPGKDSSFYLTPKGIAPWRRK